MRRLGELGVERQHVRLTRLGDKNGEIGGTINEETAFPGRKGDRRCACAQIGSGGIIGSGACAIRLRPDAPDSSLRSIPLRDTPRSLPISFAFRHSALPFRLLYFVRFSVYNMGVISRLRAHAPHAPTGAS